LNVVIRHLDNVRFAAETRGHQVIIDQPESNKGADSGMTPPEFLLVSLGSCVAYYAVEYLRARQLPFDGVAVHVDAEKASGPARLGAFRLRVTVPELEERHQQGLMRAVRACVVHNTLHGMPEIGVTLDMRVGETATAQ